MSTRLLASVAVCFALGLAACGSGSSDKDAVTKAVRGVYDALAAKDAKKVCDSISAKGKQQLTRATPLKGGKRRSCEQIFSVGLAAAGNALNQARNVKVSDVTVNGDKARATVSLRNRKSQVGLIKENGDWKLSGLNFGGG